MIGCSHRKSKQIKSVDSSGENKELSSLSGTLGSSQSLYKIPKICQLGFAETSGTRNKYVSSDYTRQVSSGRELLELGYSETSGERTK